MGIDPRLEDLKRQIERSEMHTPEERDMMIDTVTLAERINGDDDITRSSLKMMMINGIRRELRDPGRTTRIAESTAFKIIEHSITTHVLTCPNKPMTFVTYKKGEGLRVTGDAAKVFAGVLAAGAVAAWISYYHFENVRKLVAEAQSKASIVTSVRP